MDCHGQSSVDRACGTAAIATKAAAAPAPLTDVAIGDSTHELVVVDGPLIVGAGPSGIALAACLGAKNVPYTIIDRADCTASLWKQRTYARLTLQTSNKTSHLPMMPFPADYPKYPTAQQFVAYLDAYAREFRVRPRLNHTVTDAHYLDGPAQWRVQALVPVDCKSSSSSESKVVVFLARWLVVATGENADTFVPRVPGLACFRGASMHSAEYRTGQQWRDKKVLVVGAGNSGFDIALDLDNHGAVTRLSIRSQFHVLPKQMLGISTFDVAQWLKTHGFSYSVNNTILVMYAYLALGNISRYGIHRPSMGPLLYKDMIGKTLVIDMGTLAKIKDGSIQVVKSLSHFIEEGVVFFRWKLGGL